MVVGKFLFGTGAGREIQCIGRFHDVISSLVDCRHSFGLWQWFLNVVPWFSVLEFSAGVDYLGFEVLFCDELNAAFGHIIDCRDVRI